MLQLLKLVVVNIVVAVVALLAVADAYRVRHWANFFMAHNWPN